MLLLDRSEPLYVLVLHLTASDQSPTAAGAAGAGGC
jgi:hypothetical protein